MQVRYDPGLGRGIEIHLFRPGIGYLKGRSRLERRSGSYDPDKPMLSFEEYQAIGAAPPRGALES